MVAAIHSHDGGPLLAADCCVSMRCRGAATTIHRDELQKVHALSPSLAVAYSTDNVLAVHAALRNITAVEEDVRNALSGGPDDLASVLRALFEKHAHGATVLLGVLGVPVQGDAYLFTWSSQNPDVAHAVGRGEARVIGSGSAIPDIVQAAEAAAAAHQLDNLQACARFADVYTGLYSQSHHEWTARGVGGLLHFAVVGSGGQVGYSDTEHAAKFSTDDGREYGVSMHFDEAGGVWRQRRDDGAQVDVVNGLTAKLKPVSIDLLLLADATEL